MPDRLARPSRELTRLDRPTRRDPFAPVRALDGPLRRYGSRHAWPRARPSLCRPIARPAPFPDDGPPGPVRPGPRAQGSRTAGKGQTRLVGVLCSSGVFQQSVYGGACRDGSFNGFPSEALQTEAGKSAGRVVGPRWRFSPRCPRSTDYEVLAAPICNRARASTARYLV